MGGLSRETELRLPWSVPALSQGLVEMCNPPELMMILTPADFHIMEGAMRAMAPKPDRIMIDDGHREAVGRAVIRLYTAGVTDPVRLADAATVMAATRLLDRRRWSTQDA